MDKVEEFIKEVLHADLHNYLRMYHQHLLKFYPWKTANQYEKFVKDYDGKRYSYHIKKGFKLTNLPYGIKDINFTVHIIRYLTDEYKNRPIGYYGDDNSLTLNANKIFYYTHIIDRPNQIEQEVQKILDNTMTITNHEFTHFVQYKVYKNQKRFTVTTSSLENVDIDFMVKYYSGWGEFKTFLTTYFEMIKRKGGITKKAFLDLINPVITRPELEKRLEQIQSRLAMSKFPSFIGHKSLWFYFMKNHNPQLYNRAVKELYGSLEKENLII